MLSPLQAPDTLLMLLMTTAGPSGHITGARHQDDSFRMISALYLNFLTVLWGQREVTAHLQNLT